MRTKQDVLNDLDEISKTLDTIIHDKSWGGRFFHNQIAIEQIGLRKLSLYVELAEIYSKEKAESNEQRISYKIVTTIY